MDIKCPKCLTTVVAKNINIQRMFAKCQSCGTVFDFGAERDGEKARNRGPYPIPQGWDSHREANALVLTYRWFKPTFVFIAVFCLIWNSFLAFWYSMAFGHEGGTMSTLMLVFPVLHVAVGVGLTYYTLAGFLNKTIITAKSTTLAVRHTPLPWLHSGSHAVHEIDQLYCKEVISQNKNNVSYTYRLNALLRNGRERVLVSGLDEPEQALYLEYEMEKFLGITDRPVAGEFKR